ACFEQPYRYQPVTQGDQPVTYRLTQQPEGMSVNATTGEVTWTPTAAQVRAEPHPVTLVGSNGAGEATLDFAVTVGRCGKEPVVETPPEDKKTGCCQAGPGPTELFALALALLALRARAWRRC
ncbi:MAG: putative Ig domain-containing protein, partial [Myxococcota bacterium]